MVTVIDSLRGANRKYAYLLGHGDRVCVPDLAIKERKEYPWLHTPVREHWTQLMEALKVLRPEGGCYTLRSFDQLLLLAEECQLQFAWETKEKKKKNPEKMIPRQADRKQEESGLGYVIR